MLSSSNSADKREIIPPPFNGPTLYGREKKGARNVMYVVKKLCCILGTMLKLASG
jgi:hypothetical protein